MPRQRLTTELATLKGADRKDPGRFKDRKAAPKSDVPVGEAPEHLTAKEKACWFELATYAIPGTVTGADRVMLESLSVLLAEFRANRAEFTAAKYGMLFRGLSSFGMTPVDRTRLGAVKPNDPGNPFDTLDS